MSTTTVVNADLFRIVHSAVSTEETRYYLNGVHICANDGGGALMVATDGHRMLVAHDPKGVCAEACIVHLPRFALAQCRTPKMFEIKRTIEIDHAGHGVATILESKPALKKDDAPSKEAIMAVHRVLIDGTFPEWRRVVPSQSVATGSMQPTTFNGSYMKAMGEVAAELSKLTGLHPWLRVHMADPDAPCVVRFGSSRDVFGVIMPVRDSIDGFLPEFMTAPLKEAAE